MNHLPPFYFGYKAEVLYAYKTTKSKNIYYKENHIFKLKGRFLYKYIQSTVTTTQLVVLCSIAFNALLNIFRK